MPSPRFRDARVLRASSNLSLFCIGTYAASFGPVLPFLARDLDISLDTAGLVLTALFAGSITASGIIAIALHGRDMRLLALAGLICITAGVLALGFAPAWPAAFTGAVVLGVGDGLVIAALHIVVAAASDDVPGALNELNLYFAFGCIAGSLWSGAILATSGERAIVYAGIAAVAAIAAVGLIASARSGRRAGRASPPLAISRVEPAATPAPNASAPRAAWLMAVVLFFYVGAEFGLGSWVSSFARETAGAGVFGAALLSCGYWAALALGRVLTGAYFARRRDAGSLLVAAVAGAGIASLLLAISASNVVASAACAFAAGLCLGPVWPTTLAIAAATSARSATPATVTIGNAGGLVIPWAQGRVLVGAGPRQGVLVTAALCAIMLVAASVFRLRQTPAPEKETVRS